MVEVRQVGPEEYHGGDHAGAAGVLDRIRSACAETDHRDPLDEAAVLALKHHGLAGARLWLVADSGFALLRDGALDLAVAPTARRCGFGGMLAAAATAQPGPMDAWSHADHPAAAVLADRFGFERARELWVMRRPVGPVDDVRPVDGVEVRTFRPGDEAELLRVNAAAFAHHPEQGQMDAAELAERMAEPWFDPDGLFLAFRGERLVGFHWTKVHPHGDGEVYVVGIDPAAQGGGLGTLLTAVGLRHLAGRPMILHVESDNLAAQAVYTRLGFTHAPEDTHVRYRRP